MLILASMITVSCVTGYFLKGYIDALVEKVGEKMLDAIFALALR